MALARQSPEIIRNAVDKRRAITTLLRRHPYGWAESSKVKSPRLEVIESKGDSNWRAVWDDFRNWVLTAA